jgi:hypothetical protein
VNGLPVTSPALLPLLRAANHVEAPAGRELYGRYGIAALVRNKLISRFCPAVTANGSVTGSE